MEVDLQSSFGLHVTRCAQLYSWAETLDPPPALGLVYESAIGQQRKTTSLCNPPGQSQSTNGPSVWRVGDPSALLPGERREAEAQQPAQRLRLCHRGGRLEARRPGVRHRSGPGAASQDTPRPGEVWTTRALQGTYRT